MANETKITFPVDCDNLSNKTVEGKIDDNILICYCFRYSRKDIEKDFFNNNRQSAILEKIVKDKKKGRCDCAHKNPNGR